MTHATATHKAGYFLSLVAFALFVLNMGFGLAGSPLDLEGTFGTVVLTVFVAAGLIVQLLKIIEGHKTRGDFIITFLQLVAHIFAEIFIWFRTQVVGMGLPAELPHLIVGLYWASGVLDILFRYIPRELRLFDGMYKSPEALLQERVSELSTALAQVSTAQALLKQERDMLKDSLTYAEAQLKQWSETADQKVELALAAAQEKFDIAQAAYEKEVVKLEKQIEKKDRDQEREREIKEKTYDVSCDLCEWSTTKSTVRAAEYALRAHVGRSHKNGHSVIEEFSSNA